MPRTASIHRSVDKTDVWQQYEARTVRLLIGFLLAERPIGRVGIGLTGIADFHDAQVLGPPRVTTGLTGLLVLTALIVQHMI